MTEKELWERAEKLLRDLAYIAPEDVSMRRTKVFEALQQAQASGPPRTVDVGLSLVRRDEPSDEVTVVTLKSRKDAC